MSAGPECHSDHCITCGDVAMPMEVLKVDEARGIALCVDGHGARSSVEIELVLPVEPGAELLVHAGTALVRLA